MIPYCAHVFIASDTSRAFKRVVELMSKRRGIPGQQPADQGRIMSCGLVSKRRRVHAGVLMLIKRRLAGVMLCIVCIVFSASITIAAECQQQDNFSNWLEQFRQEAAGQGISRPTIGSALNGISYDPAIITRDDSQSVFQQSFEQFSGRMVSPDRLRKGANMLKRYGSILGRIEDRYGVPGEVLVAIWGLESDYGVNQGKYSTLRSLATLAYDCVAPKNFEPNWLMRFISPRVATSAQTR
jgi:membrane-bound lytic murein transglycosylase B